MTETDNVWRANSPSFMVSELSQESGPDAWGQPQLVKAASPAVVKFDHGVQFVKSGHVEAAGDALIVASGNAVVDAHGGAIVQATDNARVSAADDLVVVARGHAMVKVLAISPSRRTTMRAFWSAPATNRHCCIK